MDQISDRRKKICSRALICSTYFAKLIDALRHLQCPTTATYQIFASRYKSIGNSEDFGATDSSGKKWYVAVTANYIVYSKKSTVSQKQSLLSLNIWMVLNLLLSFLLQYTLIQSILFEFIRKNSYICSYFFLKGNMLLLFLPKIFNFSDFLRQKLQGLIKVLKNMVSPLFRCKKRPFDAKKEPKTRQFQT